jgi:signal transduction histidine kinase
MDDLRQNLSRALPHELKTPLTAIIGFTDFLLNIDRVFLPDIDEILEMQRSINECALRLEHLIENYLLYANLQLIEHDPEKRRIWTSDNIISNLSTFLDHIIPSKAEKLRRREDVAHEVENATLRISEQHLSKILTELLDNACKFSESGTPITIIGTRQDDGYRLSIKDRGYGIDGEHIDRIGAFMQFERKIHEQQGMGLGLEICRKLIRLYDGELSVESAPGQGTTVTLSLKTGEGEAAV